MQQFKAESQRLLDLVIHSIYTNHEVFLRELISNASDAIDKAYLARDAADAAPSAKDEQTAPAPFEPAINLSFDAATRTLCVADNGIGMSKDDLERCLGTIAHSNSSIVKQQLSEAQQTGTADIIGQFGVGFYSAFMVADKVTVTSRATGAQDAYCWESNGVDGFSIRPATRDGAGTTVVLHIRESTAEENLERYLDQSSLISLVRRYSNYIRYPIYLDVAQEHFDEQTGALVRDETEISRQVINDMKPLWTLAPQDTTREMREDFYHTEFGRAEAPLRCMHLQVDAPVRYSALLFIPAHAPEGLWNKDFSFGLKLFNAGVLVDDACQVLLPSHLRFVCGALDLADIKLTLSRDSIQQDERLHIVARQLEQAILENLRTMIADERAAYEEFYAEYGTGLKFAICQSQGALAPMLSTLLLYPSAQGERLISLQEYIDAAGDPKKARIYYAAGKDAKRLAQTPGVGALLAAGKDVLLATNGAQDELCFMLMGTYKGVAFCSANSAGSAASASGTGSARGAAGTGGAASAGGAGSASGAGSAAQDVPTMPNNQAQEALEALLRLSPVPLVRVQEGAFTDMPQLAARVTTEGLMTISMAKYISSKMDQSEMPKPLFVLEVNTQHTLFGLLQAALEAQDEQAQACCAEVLVGQALLAEDVQLPNPARFNEALNFLLASEGKPPMLQES